LPGPIDSLKRRKGPEEAEEAEEAEGVEEVEEAFRRNCIFLSAPQLTSNF